MGIFYVQNILDIMGEIVIDIFYWFKGYLKLIYIELDIRLLIIGDVIFKFILEKGNLKYN